MGEFERDEVFAFFEAEAGSFNVVEDNLMKVEDSVVSTGITSDSTEGPGITGGMICWDFPALIGPPGVRVVSLISAVPLISVLEGAYIFWLGRDGEVP